MKKVCLSLPVFAMALFALTFTSCKKESAGDDAQSAVDVATVSNAVNSTTDDADNATSQVKSMAGKTAGSIILNNLCTGAAVTDTSSVAQQLTLSYSGTGTCQGVIRTGTVTATLTSGTSWADKGAVITISTTGLSFTDAVTGATYSISGSITITNESGGLAYDVFVNSNPGPIQHRHQGSLQVTFPNGSQRTWKFDRTRVYTRTSNNYVNIAWMTEASGNIDATGTNRYGETFTNSITNPIQAANNPGCLWKPWTGTYQHNVSNRTATIVFGTDNNGSPIGTEGSCTAGEGYFVTYQANNKTYTKFFAYWL
jgi:hypothetical protein